MDEVRNERKKRNQAIRKWRDESRKEKGKYEVRKQTQKSKKEEDRSIRGKETS
jgi:hypothetical protein